MLVVTSQAVNTFSKISLLNDEQLAALDSLVNLFLKDTKSDAAVSKRVGVAKGAYSVPDYFDDPYVYDIPSMFGL